MTALLARLLDALNPIRLIIDDEDAFLAEVVALWADLYGDLT